MPSRYRGRFAPSPTGPLHFGSLVAAVAGYLEAKKAGGDWLLRIDDLDRFRIQPGAERLILETLEAYQLHWDGEIYYQSRQLDSYQQVFEQLLAQDSLFYCECSRNHLKRTAPKGRYGPIYPGYCREKKRFPADRPLAVRVRVDDQAICFEDQLLGLQQQNLQHEVGDFIIRRADGLFAYQFAVVIDDYLQQISHIVRGCDLLDSTARQIYLQRMLGYPRPDYLHLPLATDPQQVKLSKQTGAPALTAPADPGVLLSVLDFLGQEPPAELADAALEDIWRWALAHWDSSTIPRREKQPCGLYLQS